MYTFRLLVQARGRDVPPRVICFAHARRLSARRGNRCRSQFTGSFSFVLPPVASSRDECVLFSLYTFVSYLSIIKFLFSHSPHVISITTHNRLWAQSTWNIVRESIETRERRVLPLSSLDRLVLLFSVARAVRKFSLAGLWYIRTKNSHLSWLTRVW